MQIISTDRETEDGPLRGTSLGRSTFLSREERRSLEGAVSSPQSVKANVDLVREGEHRDNLFLVIEGWACRYTMTREGGRQISALLVPGDLCNLDSLLFDRPDCGVRTLTPATIVALPRDQALALATHHSGIARTFIWLAFIENAILGKLAVALGRRSAKGRLAHLLCELSERLDVRAEAKSRFDFPLTQEQIGDALGLTTVHVNRTMRILRDNGLVAITNRTMIIPSVAQLRRIGGFDPSYLHVEQAEAQITALPTHPKSSVSRATSFSRLGG